MKVDLTGQKFNMLTVIEKSPTKNRDRVMWVCKCECGSATEASSNDLLSGHKKSCGCIKRRPKAQDLTGQVFGKLRVMKRVGTNKNRKPLWQCKCECGKKTVVCTSDLKSGNTKSCGCLHKYYAKNHPFEW